VLDDIAKTRASALTDRSTSEAASTLSSKQLRDRMR